MQIDRVIEKLNSMEVPMETKKEAIPFTPAMVKRLNEMKAQHNQGVQSYLIACSDGMDIDGQYRVDLVNMQFVPVSENAGNK